MIETPATRDALAAAPNASPTETATETATLRRISLSVSSTSLKPHLALNLEARAGAEDDAFERAASAIMRSAASKDGMARGGASTSTTEATYELAAQGSPEATYELAAAEGSPEATYELAAAEGSGGGGTEGTYELASSDPAAHEYDVCRHDNSRETMMFDDVHPDGVYEVPTTGGEAVYELGSLPFWFLPGSARTHVKKVGEALLKHGKVGNFFVRDKKSHEPRPNARADEQPLAVLALNVVAGPDTLNCYQVEEAAGGGGWSLRGCYNEAFPTVAALIQYYSDAVRESLGLQLAEADKTLFPDIDLPVPADATYELAANYAGAAGEGEHATQRRCKDHGSQPPAPAAADAFDCSSDGFVLRAKSVRRGNPMYIKSVYMEGAAVGPASV